MRTLYIQLRHRRERIVSLFRRYSNLVSPNQLRTGGGEYVHKCAQTQHGRMIEPDVLVTSLPSRQICGLSAPVRIPKLCNKLAKDFKAHHMMPLFGVQMPIIARTTSDWAGPQCRWQLKTRNKRCTHT